jgi:hypothetical protein
MNTPDTNSWQFLTTLAGIGAVVSFFQTLASGEKVSWGKALGRAGVTAGIALGGQALLIVVPGMSLAASVGLAALLASLGTTALERVANRVIGPKDTQ